MENNQIKHQDNSKWKIAAIILIAVSVILAGATTVLAVQNGKKKSVNSSIAEEGTSCTMELPESNDNDPNTGGGEITGTRYLTVSEWDLKFQIPEEFSELSYEITTYRAAAVLTFKGTFKLLDGYDTPPIDNNKLNEIGAKWVSISRFNQDNDTCKQGEQCSQKHLISRDGYNFYYDQGLRHFLENSTYSFSVNVANYLLERMIVNTEFI